MLLWNGDRLLQALETARALLLPYWPGRIGLVYAYIGVQVALLALLLAYALALRLQRLTAARRRRRLYNVWHYLVPAFLSGEIDEEYLHHSLRRRDYPLFAEFLRPYLVDLAGKEAAQLAALLRRLGLVAYLRRGLRHKSPWRRAQAVHFFGLIGDPGTTRLIRSALDDPSDVVVYQAAKALMRLQDADSIGTVLARLSRMPNVQPDQIAVYLMEFGVGVLPALQRIVHDATAPAWLLQLSVQVLAYHHYVPATWDILYLYLNSEHRELRIACVKALATTREPTLLGFFEKLLADPDPVLRAEAARGIGFLGDASHARAVARLLDSSDFWVLKHAVEALMRLDMLPWVLLHPSYGRERFSPQAWAQIREAFSERALRGRMGRVA